MTAVGAVGAVLTLTVLVVEVIEVVVGAERHRLLHPKTKFLAGLKGAFPGEGPAIRAYARALDTSRPVSRANLINLHPSQGGRSA